MAENIEKPIVFQGSDAKTIEKTMVSHSESKNTMLFNVFKNKNIVFLAFCARPGQKTLLFLGVRDVDEQKTLFFTDVRRRPGEKRLLFTRVRGVDEQETFSLAMENSKKR